MTVGGAGLRSSCASAYAIRIPPALGGGLVTTVSPRYGTRTGSRATVSYAARSARVSRPPRAATQSHTAAAMSPV